MLFLNNLRLNIKKTLKIMHENEIASEIVSVAYRVHTEIGPGLFESVYETIMEHELRKRGYTVERQKKIYTEWDGIDLDLSFRADLIVNNKVIVELKSVDCFHPVHAKQLYTYLRLTELRLGLLINFNVNYIKDGLKRVVNNLSN